MEDLSGFEKALRSMPVKQAGEALKEIKKHTWQVVCRPMDATVRSIRLTNPVALEPLYAAGWIRDNHRDDLVLVLPAEVSPKQAEIAMIVEAEKYYQSREDHSDQKVLSILSGF